MLPPPETKVDDDVLGKFRPPEMQQITDGPEVRIRLIYILKSYHKKSYHENDFF